MSEVAAESDQRVDGLAKMGRIIKVEPRAERWASGPPAEFIAECPPEGSDVRVDASKLDTFDPVTIGQAGCASHKPSVPATGRNVMQPSLRTLLTEIVDYAGLFPPAKLQLDEAIRNYARYLRGPEAWMLGRFVCPAARLRE